MKTDKTYQIKKILTDIVYPNRCPFCGKIIMYNEYFHDECLKYLNLSENNINSVVSVCLYDEGSKKFIYRAKENGDGYMISAAAKLLADKFAEQNIVNSIDIVTSIPAKKASLRKRGYCFPSLMAKEIGALTGLPYNGRLLKNLNKSMVQKELSAEERRENMKGAFLFGGRYNINGARILLIDDVCVTGATLSSAMEILMENGALGVVKAAFAFTE